MPVRPARPESWLASAPSDEAGVVLKEGYGASTLAFSLDPTTMDRPSFYSVLRLSQLDTILKRLEILPQPEISGLVNLAVLASLGPISAFFAVSTTSYSFMVLLNVAIGAMIDSSGSFDLDLGEIVSRMLGGAPVYARINAVDPTLTKYLGSIVAIALNIALVLGILGYFGIQTTSFAAMLAESLPYWPINPSLSPDPRFQFQLDLVRTAPRLPGLAKLWVVDTLELYENGARAAAPTVNR